MVVARELTARENYPHGVPEGIDETARVYDLDVVMRDSEGREWTQLCVVPELWGVGTVHGVTTHVFKTNDGFSYDTLDEVAKGCVTGYRSAQYRKAVRKALSPLEVVFA